MKLWLDTESVGLMGPTKLVQFAVDDGPVQFLKLFRGEPMPAGLPGLLVLLSSPDTTLVAFNASHDLFHLYRLAHQYAAQNRLDSPARPIWPFACKVLDLQVPAMQRSPLAPWAFSKGANRSVAAIRRVPRIVAQRVEEMVYAELRRRIPDEISLHCSHKRVEGRRDLVTLAFWCDGRLSLKGLMRTYGVPTINLEDVWPLPPKGSEKPWLPYPDPAVHDPVEAQCDEIMRNPNAPFYAYAELDVHYLRVLYEKLGRPEPDHHSVCTHVNAYTRYHGFNLDRPVLDRSIAWFGQRVEQCERALEGIDLDSPAQRLAALRKFDPLVASSAKAVLEALAASDRPSAQMARAMRDYGRYKQRLDQCVKVAESRTGRAHPVLRVMGTRTGRSAGSEGLNWQGIAQAEDSPDGPVGLRAAVRTVAGGDFSAFEVAIAAAGYGDDQLQADLNDGIDLHSMIAAISHPESVRRRLDYPAFRALVKAHDPWAVKLRKATKAVVFGIFYGAQAPKIATVLGISEEEAEQVRVRMFTRYQGIGSFLEQNKRRFETADTERWCVDSVAAMQREASDLTGAVCSWGFEADVADTLWRMAARRCTFGVGGSIVRQTEKGSQTIDGAVSSALYGAAIAIQAAVARQAGNLPIQGTGANLCKMLLAALWTKHRVAALNVHDEIQFAGGPGFNWAAVDATISEWEAEHRRLVPSLAFDRKPTERWSDK